MKCIYEKMLLKPDTVVSVDLLYLTVRMRNSSSDFLDSNTDGERLAVACRSSTKVSPEKSKTDHNFRYTFAGF